MRDGRSFLVPSLAAVALLAVGAVELAAPASAAPSFSCTGRLSQTETVICSDTELSGLDAAMATAFEHALATVSPDQVDDIRDAQREWIAMRDKCGFDKTCIRSAILDQMQALNAIAKGAPAQPGGTAVDRAPPEERTVLGHNGSTVTMVKRGRQVEMRYSGVRPGLSVTEGTLLFRGTVTGQGRMEGTAYTFKSGCTPADYQVSGQQTNRQIVLMGPAPVRDSRSCDVLRYDPAAGSGKLVFDIAE